MQPRRVAIAPRAQRDLEEIPDRDAERILDDLGVLESPPWPEGKVKPLGGTELWEVKTGNDRSLFAIEGRSVVVCRVVNRRDLERTLKRIDVRSFVRWLRQASGGGLAEG